jgi:hypothetical protein
MKTMRNAHTQHLTISLVGNALYREESRQHKTELDRMAAMLSRLGGRGYQVREERQAYEADFVVDKEDGQPQPSVPGDA